VDLRHHHHQITTVNITTTSCAQNTSPPLLSSQPANGTRKIKRRHCEMELLRSGEDYLATQATHLAFTFSAATLPALCPPP
jgi:hypothetical protein